MRQHGDQLLKNNIPRYLIGNECDVLRDRRHGHYDDGLHEQLYDDQEADSEENETLAEESLSYSWLSEGWCKSVVGIWKKRKDGGIVRREKKGGETKDIIKRDGEEEGEKGYWKGQRVVEVQGKGGGGREKGWW